MNFSSAAAPPLAKVASQSLNPCVRAPARSRYATQGTLHIGQPTQTINLGRTYIPVDVFFEWLEEVGGDMFRGDRYHLITHNCNNFSDHVSQFLLGVPIPSHITGLPERVMAT
jgi:hypothetical protein